MIKVLRKGLWLCLVAAVTLIAAEAMARVDDALRSDTRLLASPSSSDLTIQDSLGTRGRPFAQFEKWKLNSAGFRGQELSLSPRPGCVRVAVMGASETFGYAESPGKEFPSQLAELLKNAGCFEVINTAIAGLPLPGQIQLWENWVSRFRPEIVVIYATPAFYLSNNPPGFPVSGHPDAISVITEPTFSPRLLLRIHDRLHYPDFIQRERVIRRIANATRGKPPGWVYQSVPNDRLALFRKHLDSLVTSVRSRGAEPVLVTHAMRFGDNLDGTDSAMLRAWRQFSPRATEGVLMRFEIQGAAAVRELALARGVPMADVAAQLTGRTQLFADFVHFNDRGASLVAHCIANALGPRIAQLGPELAVAK